jgi:hypothetical protein
MMVIFRVRLRLAQGEKWQVVVNDNMLFEGSKEQCIDVQERFEAIVMTAGCAIGEY